MADYASILSRLLIIKLSLARRKLLKEKVMSDKERLVDLVAEEYYKLADAGGDVREHSKLFNNIADKVISWEIEKIQESK